MTRSMTGRVRLSALMLAVTTALGVLPAVPAVAAGAPPGTISGRVSLGTTGQFAAAGDVVVTLQRYEGGTPVPYPGVSAITDADGFYTFTGLGGDRFNVVFDYVGTGSYLAHSTPYTSFFAPIVFDFTVPPAFVVAGRVSIETAGRYAGAGEVRVTATNSGRTVTALTGADGRYDLGRLAVISPGWQLQFDYLGEDHYPAWYYTADNRGSTTSPSRIDNSRDGYGYDTVLGAGVAFSGTLVMTSGQPFAGQPVTIVALTPDYSYTRFTTTTRADGSYHLGALPNGRRYLVTWGQSEDDDFAAGSAVDGNLFRGGTTYVPAQDEHLTGVDGVVAYTSIVSVDVSWPASLDDAIDAGPGQAQVFMQWFDPLRRAWTEGSVIGALDTDNRTVWSLAELPAGRYRVWVAYMFGEAPFDTTTAPEFVIDEDEWYPVEIELDPTPVADRIARLYAQLGGASSWLGPAQEGLVAVAGGTSVRYRYGWIMSHPRHGTWAVFDGGSGGAYRAAGGLQGPLGWPTGPQACSAGRCWQPFVGGLITSTPQYGAQVIWGGFVTEWLASGGLDGPYGAALNGLSSVNGPAGAGWQQNFQGGVLTQTASGFRLVPYPIAMGWLTRGGGAGWLGWPTEPAQCDLWCAQSFTGGIVHSQPAGTQTVTGGFISEWRARGGLNGIGVAWTPLDYTTSPALGWWQSFAEGTLTQSAHGFHLVKPGWIADAWMSAGGPRSWVGFPVSDQVCTSLGCSQRFAGALMTSDSRSAFPVVGSLANHWTSHDGASTIGPALNSMRFNPVNGGGWAQHFSRGVITQSVAAGTVFTPYGPILNTWYHYGAEATWLGWPVGTQTCTSSGCVQRFQNGVARSDAAGAVSFSRS